MPVGHLTYTHPCGSVTGTGDADVELPATAENLKAAMAECLREAADDIEEEDGCADEAKELRGVADELDPP